MPQVNPSVAQERAATALARVDSCVGDVLVGGAEVTPSRIARPARVSVEAGEPPRQPDQDGRTGDELDGPLQHHTAGRYANIDVDIV